jgi:type VI secretion system protein ImpI
MSIALTAVVLDSQSNQSFEMSFERFPVRIGRNQLADLHIDRPYVSQFHAAVEVMGNKQIVVKDLGSTNGTVYRGQKLVRDQAVDVTALPEFQIGPVLIRLAVREISLQEAVPLRKLSILDIGTSVGQVLLEQRTQVPQPGQEDPFVRQLQPYIEAYRSAWANVYRLIYDHLPRLPADVRTAYLRRLLIENPAVGAEADFQRVSQYYGVPAHAYGELSPPMAAMAAIAEIAAQLAPDHVKLDTPASTIAFARRLRDVLEVFLKCFVSLRDGYNEFEAEVLRKDRMAMAEQGNRVGAAKDHKELGAVLLSEQQPSDVVCHQLHETFVEVMTHQVALLNGVMEGVKQLLGTLSPREIEQRYERKGKKGGLFSNKYEGLWQEYQTAHADYQGEDKETFLIIFGPQFSRAYAATTGEAYNSPGDGGPSRLNVSANQRR